MRDAIRVKNYSARTEKTYVEWIRRYILFHNKRHPKEMGALEVQTFITYLASEKHVAASTQNQALSAGTFLYRHVLKNDIEPPSNLIRAEKSQTLPVVLTHQEAMSVIGKNDRDSTINGKDTLRKWFAFNGMHAPACQRD